MRWPGILIRAALAAVAAFAALNWTVLGTQAAAGVGQVDDKPNRLR